MTTLNLIEAKIIYGNSFYPVQRSEHAPIPDLDLDNLEDSVFKIVAVLSNQSGGHTLSKIRVSITRCKTYAYLNGNGFAAAFGTVPAIAATPTPEQIAAYTEQYIDSRTNIEYDWAVSTDQYGEGWKRAVKVFPKAPKGEGEAKPRWRR